MSICSCRRSFASALRYDSYYVERCAKALETALYATPAYRQWRVRDPGREHPVFVRLAALPALTKADLRRHGPEGFVPEGRDMARGLASGEIDLAVTSGTTGDQVVNLWYQPWWDATEAATWKLNAHARKVATGSHREAILTSPLCVGVPCEEGYLSTAQRRLGRFLYLSERSDPSTWSEDLMDRMVGEINAFAPVILEANPSFLARLSRHIFRRGLRVHSPGLIVLTYENPSLLHLRQIRRVFTAPIASSYGSTEAGHIFMQCEAGRMHQVTACCHVDFLPFRPEHGGPTLGRILVTTFDNPWRALLRFDTGDVIRLDEGDPCPCGQREGLTLSTIEGRTINLTRTPRGQAVTQGAVDRILAAVDGLVEYQLLQTAAAVYEVRFVAEDAGPSQVAGEVYEALRGLYGPEAQILTTPVAAIAPDPPGKYRLSRTLQPPDADSLLDEQYAPTALYEEGP